MRWHGSWIEWWILILLFFILTPFLFVYNWNPEDKILFSCHHWVEGLKEIFVFINYLFNLKERGNCILHFTIQLKIGAASDVDRQGPGTNVYAIKCFRAVGILSLGGLFRKLLLELIKQQMTEMFK